ncbi:MAG TPA: galactokinase, partial [Candidatus Goldiibacteriota bacterium]|nr:galactokinase [Candidatus Goldiibacteriota bacterium]
KLIQRNNEIESIVEKRTAELMNANKQLQSEIEERREAVKALKSRVYKAAESYGKCEVILYSADHKKSLHELPVKHIRKIIDLWVSRDRELSSDSRIKYVFPFENRGEEVGVTMLHPHGQIYAYPFVPLKLKTELENAEKFHATTGKCLICEMNGEEAGFKGRVVHENAHFLAYLPHFTDYPYGIFITSKRHLPGISSLSAGEKNSLAEMLRTVEGAFDRVFNRPFPFMMCVHQAPVNSPEYGAAENYFHFHIEFYPPLRAKDRIKWYASSESGAWAAANVAVVEDTAKQLVSAKFRHFASDDGPRLQNELKAGFIKKYGPDAKNKIRLFSAPARINIIGEHTDYNGGLVMPAAIGLKTYIAVRKRKDSKILIANMDRPEHPVFDVKKKAVFDKKTMWPNYLAGVLEEVKKSGRRIRNGFEAYFFSDIPEGTGLSSSAAFELAFVAAMNGLFNLKINPKEAALLCQKAENEFVGMKCGIMDQFASALSMKGKAMLLDCATLKAKYYPFDFGDYRIVVANTDKKRELAGSKYNERLKECMIALSNLQKGADIKNLCELDVPAFEKFKHLIKDPVCLKRARHAVYENARVKEACAAIEKGNVRELGKLLCASHESLRDDYEVTGPELDAMFEEGIKQRGCAGGRMTGAGFGGCAIFMVHKDSVYDFKLNVAAG